MLTNSEARYYDPIDGVFISKDPIGFSGGDVNLYRYTDQEEVGFNVYQDHSGKAQFPHECEDTGKGGEIKNIPKSTNDRPHNIVIDFSYDLDGLAVIKASIPATGHSLTISHGKSANRMDDAEIAEATRKVSELWKKNDKSKNFEGIIDKAERLSPRLSQSDRQKLKHCIVELKQALTASDDLHITKVSDKLIDLMYDLENQ